MIAALFIVLVCAVLNRLRGDASWKPVWLRGRALFYVAPAIGAVALLVQPWPVALSFAAGYAFWAVWAWGHILLRIGGASPPNRSPSVLEAALLLLPGRFLPVFARMLFVLPCVIAVAALADQPWYWLAGPAFAAAAAAAYLAFLEQPRSYDWFRAEVAVGALWGVLLLLGA